MVGTVPVRNAEGSTAGNGAETAQGCALNVSGSGIQITTMPAKSLSVSRVGKINLVTGLTSRRESGLRGRSGVPGVRIAVTG